MCALYVKVSYTLFFLTSISDLSFMDVSKEKELHKDYFRLDVMDSFLMKNETNHSKISGIKLKRIVL